MVLVGVVIADESGPAKPFCKALMKRSILAKETHEQVVAYLQSRFGPIERMPGSMMRGLSQTYTWRGPETQINLTYQGMGARGFIFIESRTFAARFIDMLPEHAY